AARQDVVYPERSFRSLAPLRPAGTETANIIGIVELAFAETGCFESPADEDQCRPFGRLGCKLCLDVGKRPADDAFFRPGGADDDGDGAVGAIERLQLRYHPVQRMNGEMNCKGCPGRAEGGESFAVRHFRGAPGYAGQNKALGDFRNGQFAPQGGGGGGEGRNAWG